MWTHAKMFLALPSSPSRRQVGECLDLLELPPWEPSHWGWMSDDRRPYSRDAMLGWMFSGDQDLAGFEPTVRRWSRPVYKFIMSGLATRLPFAEVLVLPPATAHELRGLFGLSEELAGTLGVELGGVSLNGSFNGKPVRCGPLGMNLADVRARGVDELFPRTFFSAAIWARVEGLFGHLHPRTLSNGVVAVDLLDEPWLAPPQAVSAVLAEARRSLERAGLAPGPNLDAGLRWAPLEEA